MISLLYNGKTNSIKSKNVNEKIMIMITKTANPVGESCNYIANSEYILSNQVAHNVM